MAKRGVLNQRFNSIFDDNSFDEDDEGVSTLKLTDIEPNKSQPRKNFDITALNTLADSIRQNGVIQPLLVRSMPDGTYQIVGKACHFCGTPSSLTCDYLISAVRH